MRALAAVNCAATWPVRRVEIRNAARGAACDAGDAMADIGNAAQMSAFEARDAIPDMDEYVWRLESDARALGIANRVGERRRSRSEYCRAYYGILEGGEAGC